MLPSPLLPLLVTLLAALSLTSCKERKLPERQIDSRLSGFLEDFLQDAIKYKTPIDTETHSRLRVITFVDDLGSKQAEYGQEGSHAEDLAGLCTTAEIDSTVGAGPVKRTTGSRSWKEVWIAADMAEGPEWTLRELMYHELGHCLLGRDHAVAKPHTIMSPAVSNDGKWLNKNWDRLVRGLFEGR